MELEAMVQATFWLGIIGYLLCVAAWRIFWHNDNDEK